MRRAGCWSWPLAGASALGAARSGLPVSRPARGYWDKSLRNWPEAFRVLAVAPFACGNGAGEACGWAAMLIFRKG